MWGESLVCEAEGRVFVYCPRCSQRQFEINASQIVGYSDVCRNCDVKLYEFSALTVPSRKHGPKCTVEWVKSKVVERWEHIIETNAENIETDRFQIDSSSTAKQIFAGEADKLDINWPSAPEPNNNIFDHD